MSLPQIYSQPDNPDDLRAWVFNHAANHYDIVRRVAETKTLTLQQFCLDPLDPTNRGNWLYWHQIMHNQANAALGTSGNDLLSLDWDDPDAFAEWLRLNGDEHQRFSGLLSIG
jgi:hypothetical protein